MTETQSPSKFPLLPTLLTLGNGICGLGCITLATGNQAEAGESRAIFVAGLLIFVAMLFDLLDGQVARLTKQTSKFGMELDSLCDMISFGVAPVFIMLTCSKAFHSPLPWGARLLWGIGALFAACVAMRLARYNVDHGKHAPGFFQGLPSPAAAGTVASFAIAVPALQELTGPTVGEGTQELGESLMNIMTSGMPIMMVLLALLMVSRIPYPHLFSQIFRGHRSFYQLVQALVALVAIMVVHELALPLIFCCFVLVPPATLIVTHLARRWNEAYAR